MFSFTRKTKLGSPIAADPYTSIYPRVFSQDAIAQKRFYNLEPGSWRHQYWTNVGCVTDHDKSDTDLVDVPWDVSKYEPVAIPDGCAELVYCSHVVQRHTDEQDRLMFRDAARILKPGGVFRVTCPNIEQYHEAYQRRDVFVNYHYGHDYPFGAPGKNTYASDNMVVWLVNEIASQLVQSVYDGHQPVFAGKVDELERIFAKHSLEEACDQLCGMVDYKLQRMVPGHHINWWTHDKMRRELKAAGFSRVMASVPGGSVAAVMRDRAHFDRVSPTFSLFVDAIK